MPGEDRQKKRSEREEPVQIPVAQAAKEGDVADENGVAPEADPAADSPAGQIQKLQAEKQDLMNTLVRRQADFENYRKRVEKERQQDRHRGVELLIENLLPVLDGLDRALADHSDPAFADHQKGFLLIRKQLGDLLAKSGLERVESKGKHFDPHFHHAIERVETTEHPDGTVLEEFQPGYVFHGHVLRPAMVRVAAAPEHAAKSGN